MQQHPLQYIFMQQPLMINQSKLNQQIQVVNPQTMNKPHQSQLKPISTNDLFSLPPDRYTKQFYSQNFIQLFKNALTKVYSPKKQSSRHITEPTPKHSLASISPIQKVLVNEHTTKKPTDYVEKQSFPSYLTQRQRLINEILNGKTEIMTSKNKQLISKRCKTLENPQSTQDCTSSLHDSKSPKIPLRLRQAFNSYRNRSNHQDRKLPPIASKLSPNSKKSLLQNFQIINKYRMLQAQYRSNQFISTPIEIFSVCSPTSKGQTSQSRINIGISKLTKESIIRSKSRKIKYALDGVSRNPKLTTQNPQNPQLSRSNRLDTLMEQDQILQQMWKDKEKTIQTIKLKINDQTHNMMKKTKKKKKLIQRQPLDEYFRPWENSSQAKRYSQFSCHQIFPMNKDPMVKEYKTITPEGGDLQ